MTNPIQYISRTFDTILNDINNDPDLADKPDWFKRIWAGVGDVFTVYTNAEANQKALRTAFTRKAVADLCELIDYYLASQTTSSGLLLYQLRTDVTFPVSIDQDDLVAYTTGSVTQSAKRFEARSGITVSETSETFTADAGTDILTVTNIYQTGSLLRLTTTDTLPDPLEVDTDYYVIYITNTTIKLATTLNDAFAGIEIDITDAGLGTHTLKLYSFIKTSYQQQSLTDLANVGTSDGTTGWQEFNLPDLYVLEDTIYCLINGDTWEKVDSWIDSTSTDKHFRIYYNSDGSSFIRFGDGIYGAIPGAFDIEVYYAYGGGADSNVNFTNRIINYGGTDTNITGVTNPTTFSGGSNEEDIESAKRNAPILLKARDRFVTSSDGLALTLNYGGVANAVINKNAFGVLSAQVLIVPTGGGLPSSQLKTDLQQYLIDRTILESIDIRVQDPVYVVQNVTSAMKVLPGYTYADIEDYFDLAYILLFSEITYEILLDYEANGIESAVSLINNYYSKTYDASDYAQIIKFLDNVNAVVFGSTIQEIDITGFIDQHLIGCDYLTISAPSFPIALDVDEITQIGSRTLSEIT
jgi:hypothetical protein